MCGIAGFIDTEMSQEKAEQLIDRMSQIIRHRGPDEQGTWAGDGIALGMRRLSIIDVPGGHQPIFNEDKSMLIVFNGEIYNYQELMHDLEARGHKFETVCDTEVIIHAYEEYGDDCVKYLRGMFGFAIWDRNRRRLFMARDRFGKRPFNYYWDGKRLIFGSEIKSILEADVPREVNPIALDEYLVYRYVPAPNTIFKGIMKLPAAHTMVYENGQISLHQYWDLSFEPTCNDDEETAVARIREMVQDAIKCRLMSEVPLGAFLSGGTDSSIIVGYMSQMVSEPVKTFSIGFDEDDFSELPYARRIAEHFKTDHHEFVVRPDLVSVLPQLVWAYDEPFGDASMLPTYYVAKLAREHVAVALSGDGGDEIFGGYTHYIREMGISRIPWAARQVLGLGSMLMPDGMRGKRRLRNINNDLSLRYVQGTMLFPVGTRERMYQPEFFAGLRNHSPYARQADQFKAVKHLDVTAQMQYVDSRNYLVDDIMIKVDKACMFNSLEARAPMMDQYLAEYVASLPPSLRFRDGTLKYLMKKAFADLVPDNILNRKKQGFSAPLAHWMRKDLASFARETLESKQAQQRGIFDPQFVNQLLESHKKSTLVNHSQAIWAMLTLELWFRAYMDAPKTQADQAPEIYSMSKR